VSKTTQTTEIKQENRSVASDYDDKNRATIGAGISTCFKNISVMTEPADNLGAAQIAGGVEDGGITLTPLTFKEGDPFIWSNIHLTKIEFKHGSNTLKSKKACYIIERAAVQTNTVRSVGYNSKLGRTIEMTARLATMSEDDEGYQVPGETSAKIKILVNQKKGTVELIKNQ
jgi:hypothetical protein